MYCWAKKMNTLPTLGALVVSLIPLVSYASFPADAVNWRDRLKISAYSDRIYLIKVERVVLGEEKIMDALKVRKFRIEGRMLEVLRGEAPENPFIHNDVLTSYTDPYKSGSEVLAVSLSRMTGAADCKEGQRYVVIHFEGLRAFVPIDDGDAWRALIRPRIPENAPRPAPERTRPNKTQ